MKWVSSVHCTITDCPHRDGESECCKKTDVIITETGCRFHTEAVKKAGAEEKQTGIYKKTEEI